MRDVNENLGAQLTAAGQMSMQLKKQLAEGDNVVRRLSKIVASAARPRLTAMLRQPAPRPPTPRNLSSANAIAEAAQAFSERKRSNGLAA